MMSTPAHSKALHIHPDTKRKKCHDNDATDLPDYGITSKNDPYILSEESAASAAREKRAILELLGQIDLLDYIELDDRPTFVVDLLTDEGGVANVIFCNTAFNSSPGLLEVLFGLVSTAQPMHTDFQRWILDLEDPRSFQSAIVNLLWRKAVMKERWLIVRGSPEVSSPPLVKNASAKVSHSAQNPNQKGMNPYFGSRSEKDSESTSVTGISDVSQTSQARIFEQVKVMGIEALAAENRFHRMADLIPVGMHIISPEGTLLYANEALYKMTGAIRNDTSQFPWLSIVDEAIIPVVEREWKTLATRVTPTSSEIRLKKKWNLGDLSGPVWVLASSYPEVHPDGSVKWIMGTITDISYQKASEELLKRKTEEAVESKNRLERFVDMTSHEIRNPLTAILQCADEIISTFSTLRKSRAIHPEEIPISVLEGSLDAAQTISICAQHQNRIVQDIGTLSKLDSEMIAMVPDKIRPIKQVESVVKMLQKDLQKNDIEHSLVISESYHGLEVDHLWLDAGRLNQILVNLLTNAIKFTKLESIRCIKLTVEAFLDPPSTFANSASYAMDEAVVQDPTTLPTWGNGAAVFLQVTVTDTGPGMTESQMESLFQRFKQASPRTYVKYGGSGLGLFISRKLVELHGGRIGVTGEVGKGSTFAFYVKTRRATEVAWDM